MPHRQRAAIYVHLGAEAPRDKQEAVCMAYCEARGYRIYSEVFHLTDALALIRDGTVALIVTAYQPSDRIDIVAAVEAAGGRIENARPGRIRREVGRMIEKLFDRGLEVAEIADVTGMTTGEVRVELIRRGKYRT
jgi:hypothetical protein